jgi:hypothetical protein
MPPSKMPPGTEFRPLRLGSGLSKGGGGVIAVIAGALHAIFGLRRKKDAEV